MKTILVLLALMIWAAPLRAQTSSTAAQTQNQVRQQDLPPAPTCFTCDCNTQDFACRTPCARIADFVRRQQCEADCGLRQAACLQNAQLQQRAVDAQRAALVQQQSSASGR